MNQNTMEQSTTLIVEKEFYPSTNNPPVLNLTIAIAEPKSFSYLLTLWNKDSGSSCIIIFYYSSMKTSGSKPVL